MRCTALVLAAVLTAAGCGSSPSTPSNVIVFTAPLSAANEVPAVTNSELSGRGTVTITMTVTRDSANAITAGLADFQVTLNSFPTTTAITMSHIHSGAAGASGPIEVNTGLAPGEVSLTTGSASYSKLGVFVTAVDAEAFVANPAGFYFNVHSVANGPGVARGQLVKQ